MNDDSESKPSRAIRPQIILSCACCLVGMSYGMSTGHSAVLLPHLQSGEDALVIDEDTGSWIASVYAIASPVGCLLSGVSMDIWGRRKINILGNVGMIIGWLLIAFAENVPMLIYGRIIEGFSRSALATCITVFVDELADPVFRGFIVCSIFTCVSVGITAIASLGALVDWRTASVLAASLSLIISIFFFFVPESPTWFVKKDRMEEAESALQWLWGPGKELQAKEELRDLNSRLRPKDHYQITSLFSRETLKSVKGFFTPRILKPFIILHLFNVLQAFCGLGIFTFYTINIISKTRVEGTEIMNDYWSTVVMSLVRVILILISSFLMLSVGRRVLAMISGTLSSFSAICLGIILFLRIMESGSPITPQTESYTTFTLILIYAGSMSFGFFALPSIMIGETQPSHVRGFACGYIYTMNDLLLGGVVKMYPWMIKTVDIHGLFLFFGISCAICTLLVFIFLPETQGLTLQEIEDYFKQPNVMWLTRHKYSNQKEAAEEINVDIIPSA